MTLASGFMMSMPTIAPFVSRGDRGKFVMISPCSDTDGAAHGAGNLAAHLRRARAVWQLDAAAIPRRYRAARSQVGVNAARELTRQLFAERRSQSLVIPGSHRDAVEH